MKQARMLKSKFFAGVLSLALVFSTLGILPIFAQETAEKQITILHTNDIHSRVLESKTEIGYGKIATVIKEYKAQNANTLVLDAGDSFHGQTISTLVKGESILNIMNEIGYDAMTAGNHDFNYGYERLLALATMAKFPILGGNVKKADGTSLLPSYIIKEVDGIKVGIFGVSTPETAYKTHPKNVEGLTFADPVAQAKAAVAELQGKVDIIIALAHLGTEGEYTSTKVAAEVAGIDLIVDGHSHDVLKDGQAAGDTLIVSAGEYGKYVGVVELTVKANKVTSKKASLVDFETASKGAADEAVMKVINEVKAAQESVLSEVVSKVDVKLEGTRDLVRAGETNLGNLITNAMIAISGADVALTNGGGIRASIEAGDVTKGDVITVLPFGNYIITKKVTGADLKAALEHGTKSYPEASGGFPHVAGIQYAIDTTKPAGERVVDVTVNGKALELSKEYILATNDFMAVGGDGYEMFKSAPVANNFPALDEAVIAYLQSKNVVIPAVEGRVTVKKEEVKQEEPVQIPVQQPIQETVEEAQPQVTTTVYVVKSGDVLWRIAKNFGTTWEKLKDMNKLKNAHLIFPGQKITVPAK